MANQEGYITRSKERRRGDDIVSVPQFSRIFTGRGRQANKTTVQSRNTEQTQPPPLEIHTQPVDVYISAQGMMKAMFEVQATFWRQQRRKCAMG